MSRELQNGKNLKDSSSDLGLSIKDTPAPISYTKTDKLVIALYMVTDIIDKDEPLRNKLRTLGTGIISDINSAPFQAVKKISEIMSFLDIASAMNIISQMNTNILRKEFLELDQSIRESGNKAPAMDQKIDLSEFFTEESRDSHPSLLKDNSLPEGRAMHRLGVQKGSTLMKALSNKNFLMSDKENSGTSDAGFDVLKKQRRQDIVNVIKIMGGNATIKDIRDKARALPAASALVSCGEKTLQRELSSMVEGGVLYKTGEKRWSRYFVK